MTNKVTLLICAILATLVLSACAESADPPKKDKNAATTTETEASSALESSEAIEENWRDQLPPEIVSELEAAFREIGENPDNIVSVEYVRTRETGLFDRRDYKVSFDRGNLAQAIALQPPWKHHPEYRATTQEWHEGEPEREQYPREYLVTLKFWFDDDSTNLNQWTHTGNGELQK